MYTADAERVVVWIPSGGPGWMLEEAIPYDARSIGGGLRTLYEIAAAVAAAGRKVELRGVVSLPDLDAVCAAAGARPELPDEPRPAAASDTVIVPEGIDDPAVHARVVLSPARPVLMLLGPPGFVGWPFCSGPWSPPDPLTVPIDAVGRPEHFRAAAGLGYELWTHTAGLQRAAEAAGVACRLIGNGVPGAYPLPPPEKDIDVVWLRGGRWAPLARPVVRELEALGVRCVALDSAGHREVLEHFGRARVVLHPLRVEGHSRVGCEARAMGAVPAVLSTNPYSVGLDEAGGALAVDDPAQLAGAIRELLDAPERLARLSAAGMQSARRQTDWPTFVDRVDAALAGTAGDLTRGAREAIGAALRDQSDDARRELASRQAETGDVRAELEQHQEWNESMKASRSWRLTAPLRAAKRSVLGDAGTTQPALEPVDPQPVRGRIEWPPDGAERPRAPVDIHGWCLFAGSTVARVEVRLNDGPAQLARPAMEPGFASAHPDAPLCGFEHKVDLAELRPGETTVCVEAVAYAVDGRRFALEPVEYSLAPAPAAHADHDRRYAELRRRSIPPARALPSRRAGGMRVLVFTHTLGHGGGSLYLLELLRRLRRTPGVECEVVSLADGPLRDLLEDAGVLVHVTDASATTSPERYEAHIAELVAWSGHRFDVVLANTLGAFAGADVATRLGIPAVWVIHESFRLPMFWFTAYPPSVLHPYVRARAEAALRGASAVLFVAEPTRRLFLQDADPDRLVTLPYGIELEAIDAARRSLDRAATRRRLGVDEHARVVLCLGSIEPRKSQALLAQAFAQVADHHPDVQLALVGATDAAYCARYRTALAEYLDRAGLTERVRVVHETDDPLSWHAVADVLVCASDIESLPRSIAEAMAFGTPVLSTRVFGVPELIEDGVNGYLCEMRDVASLAGGLDRVLSADRAELAAVTRAGRDRVHARHDPDAYAANVLRLLEGFVADREALPLELLAPTVPLLDVRGIEA